MGNKKKLLEENTVRSFMKLANLDVSLSSNFLRENYEDLEEAMDDMEAGEEVDMEMSGDEPPMDMGMEDAEADAPVDPALQDAIEGAIKDFIEGGAEAAGVEVDVADGDEGPPMDDMGDMDDMEGEDPLDDINVIDTDAVVLSKEIGKG